MPTVPARRVDKKKAGDGWWSQKERLQAVSAYVLLGKVTLVSATTGVPEDTLRKWKMADWWKEAEDEIRRSNKIELSGKLSNIVNATLLQLEDRVANGDFFFNPRTGKWDRKPISASQASKITSDMIDKTLILEKNATQESITEEGLDSRLKKLRDEMIRFAKAKTIEGEVLHVQEIPSESERDVLEPVQEAGTGRDPGQQPTPAEGGDGCPGVHPSAG